MVLIETIGQQTKTCDQKLENPRPKETQDQSGYEPLNLENGLFLNSDNFDATDLRF